MQRGTWAGSVKINSESNMKFQLNQGQFHQFKKSLILKTTPLLLIPFIVVLLFNQVSGTTKLIQIPIFLLIIFFVMVNSVKKQRKAWVSFQLIIDDFKVERIQEGFPSISVLKSDIVEAVEAPNGAITLIAKERSNSIIIPHSIENKEDLLREISKFVIIKKAKSNFGLLALYGGSILGVILLFSFMLSTNSIIIISTGIALASLCFWAFVEIQRNKNYDKKVKRASYTCFILIIVVVVKLFMILNPYMNYY